jgi:hypothetical protein
MNKVRRRRKTSPGRNTDGMKLKNKQEVAKKHEKSKNTGL